MPSPIEVKKLSHPKKPDLKGNDAEVTHRLFSNRQSGAPGSVGFPSVSVVPFPQIVCTQIEESFISLLPCCCLASQVRLVTGVWYTSVRFRYRFV